MSAACLGLRSIKLEDSGGREAGKEVTAKAALRERKGQTGPIFQEVRYVVLGKEESGTFVDFWLC